MLAKSKYGPPSKKNASVKEQGLDDITLWQSFKKNNDLAFSILYNKYVQRLYDYGMHACKDKELVLDCIQELFARLWDKRDTVAVADSVSAYLFQSFRRLLMNRLIRKRKLSLSPLQDDAFEFAPSSEEDMVEKEIINERSRLLNASLETLTKRQREAIFLKFYNELSYQEVANVMDLHVDSVYNLISKAIEGLRKNIKTVTFIL
jgi:RNA polymerase sigma factor (sigma-70 family)